MGVLVLVAAWLGLVESSRAVSTAFISDAWWTFQQDCNGDGCKAGIIAGEIARLNWETDVTNCNGTLTVLEKIYTRPCGASTWNPIYTNAAHSIAGCRTTGEQHLDVRMSNNCVCLDYKIEIYRAGQNTADYARSSSNDADLASHREQWAAQDFCLSDFFATCVSLSGSSGSESDNTSTATKEPEEPNHAGNPGGHSLWYCWSSSTNTPVTFDTVGSTFDTVLAVYTGNAVSNLTVIASNDDIAGATNRQSKVTFTPTPGVSYKIAVDGFGGATGIATLNWNQSTQALPDLIIWGPAVSPSITSRTFTTTDCEVLEGCETAGTHRLLTFNTESRNIGSGDLMLGNPATNKLFVWASCHGHYHFEQFAEYNLLDTNGNVAATGHKVGFCLEDGYSTGLPGAPATAKYNCSNQGIQHLWADIYSAGLPCQYIDITAVPPGDYWLQLTINPDNLITEARTDNNITVVEVTIPPADCGGGPPSNDNFSNAVVVAAAPFTYAEFNNCATKQAGEPAHAGNAGGHSVWFNWTPAVSHVAVVTTKQSDFDTLLGIYTGSSVGALTQIAANDDIVLGSLQQSYVTFQAQAGVTYHIAVDGYNGAQGTIFLNVDPPANDDYSNALAIATSSGTVSSSTIGASKEPYEAAHAGNVGGHSIWFKWVAPGSGPVDFNTTGSGFDTTLAVYTGKVVTNLTSIAANDDDIENGGLATSRLWFNAVAGTNYYIAVDGFGGDYGNYILSWNMDSRLSVERLMDGKVKISLTGVDWQRYTLLSSTSNSTWMTNKPTITMAGGMHGFTNNPGTNQGLIMLKAARAP
jgi:hypothetical protein